ncbi:MAG: mandelate racemase/muconate lactonizing enzyme family protein [Bacteroidales bacterium]
MKRRLFLRNSASAGLLAALSGCRPPTESSGTSASAGEDTLQDPGEGPYLQLGRTEDYREFQVIPPGKSITRIETFARPDIALVRITLDSGEEGWGQISTYNSDIASTILHRNLAGLVLNQDPSRIDAIVDRCIERNLKYPWSYVNRALGGIDTALWDLYGRIAGKPVCELLGGASTPVRIYGSSMSRTTTPEQEVERMIRLRDEKGITAFKYRIGTEAGHNRDAWENRSEQMIESLGNALAGSCDLLADANSCYTPDRAIHYGRMLESNGVVQFEEPSPYWETDWIREVTATLDLKVSGGEQNNDIAHWRRMINRHTFDIIQPDPLYLGGITRTWRTALMAHEAGIPCIPHSANHGMVTLYTLHLMRAIPNPGKYLEYSIEFEDQINREAREMYDPPLVVSDGSLDLPPEPGWGVTVHQAWLEGSDYRVSVA